MNFAPTPRTTSLRSPEKLRYDKATAYEILDTAYICHLGYVHDGTPRVLPTAYARIDDRLYFHGSTGSRAFLSARDEGVEVCATVTLEDGIVFSRSWFHHSVNYRCVMAHGRARLVQDPDRRLQALAAMIDALADGRSADSRPPSAKELAQTAVLELVLTEVSVKVRRGGPNDDAEDLSLPHWAGHLPLSTVAGEPVPDTGVGHRPPPYLL